MLHQIYHLRTKLKISSLILCERQKTTIILLVSKEITIEIRRKKILGASFQEYETTGIFQLNFGIFANNQRNKSFNYI